MRFRPLKFISRAFTALIIFLAFPATAILASWNALPGDFLYPVKRDLEKTALALVPSSFFESELRLKFLDRRTDEVTSSIVKSPGNTQALIELLAEARAAESVTVELEPTDRTQASIQLIQKLTTTQQTLETTKQSVIQSNPTIASPPSSSDTTPGSAPSTTTNLSPQLQTSLKPAPKTTPEQAQTTVDSIEQTQAELNAIIDQIENNLPSNNRHEDKSPPGQDKHQSNDKDESKSNSEKSDHDQDDDH